MLSFGVSVENAAIEDDLFMAGHLGRMWQCLIPPSPGARDWNVNCFTNPKQKDRPEAVSLQPWGIFP
jgi:hypothetical protein